jgi:dipeptidyl aminopeptidase/acylaminoacyl peptidase
MSTHHHITQNGIALTLRLPSPHENLERVIPCIILCHGFGGTRDVLLPKFADAFSNDGFATITFDYRGFGESIGEKGRIMPGMQITDTLTIIEWAREQNYIDGERIGIWGTSLGGSHAIAAAAQDPVVRCVVSQLPIADGELLLTGNMSENEKTEFVQQLDMLERKRYDTGRELWVGITRILNDSESKAFFNTLKEIHPEIDIKIPFLTIREMLRYHPVDFAKMVLCPTLLMVAEQDRVNPPEQGFLLYDALPSPIKHLHQVDLAGHYDFYDDDYFELVFREQLAWFNEYL